MATRHFLSLLDLSPDELKQLLQRAIELKSMQHAGEVFEPIKNKVMAMIFEKSSTRTRVSFEAGMALNMGQWLSIPLVLGGIALLVFPPKKGFWFIP